MTRFFHDNFWLTCWLWCDLFALFLETSWHVFGWYGNETFDFYVVSVISAFWKLSWLSLNCFCFYLLPTLKSWARIWGKIKIPWIFPRFFSKIVISKIPDYSKWRLKIFWFFQFFFCLNRILDNGFLILLHFHSYSVASENINMPTPFTKLWNPVPSRIKYSAPLRHY